MIKILLLVVLAWLVYALLKKYRSSVERDEQDKPSAPMQEDMVRCTQCGVHLPKSEAILSRGEFFCCDEHRHEHQH